jgi:hypothetical protein
MSNKEKKIRKASKQKVLEGFSKETLNEMSMEFVEGGENSNILCDNNILCPCPPNFYINCGCY